MVKTYETIASLYMFLKIDYITLFLFAEIRRNIKHKNESRFYGCKKSKLPQDISVNHKYDRNSFCILFFPSYVY